MNNIDSARCDYKVMRRRGTSQRLLWPAEMRTYIHTYGTLISKDAAMELDDIRWSRLDVEVFILSRRAAKLQCATDHFREFYY